jgi:hypothetical protein
LLPEDLGTLDPRESGCIYTHSKAREKRLPKVIAVLPKNAKIFLKKVKYTKFVIFFDKIEKNS